VGVTRADGPRSLLQMMRANGPENFALNDEGLCPKSYYSNTMRAYALGALLQMMRAYALRVITLTRWGLTP